MSLLSQGPSFWRYVKRGFGSGQLRAYLSSAMQRKGWPFPAIFHIFSPGKLWQGMVTNRMVRVYILFIYKRVAKMGLLFPKQRGTYDKLPTLQQLSLYDITVFHSLTWIHCHLTMLVVETQNSRGLGTIAQSHHRRVGCHPLRNSFNSTVVVSSPNPFPSSPSLVSAA